MQTNQEDSREDPQRLESAYAALGEAIDAVDPSKERVFLAKLALMLALQLPNHDALVRSIERCRKDL